MATPIREHCLDENDVPIKAVIKMINQAFKDRGGCPKRKCGATCYFNVHSMKVVCKKRHRGFAYDDPYAEVVFSVINKLEEEESKKHAAASKEAWRLRMVEKAKREAEALGQEFVKFHDRPSGAAPTGQTWSYHLGKWIDC